MRGAANSRHVVFAALLVAGYVATGRLGLLLAVPPGYATAIFPPAGIAATAMLVAGGATLPWTFLGSLILNLWIGYDAGSMPVTMAALAALLIAAGSTAQAALTGWVLRRAIGYPAALDDGGQILRFLLLTPPCCMTSASLSLSGLAALGAVAQRDIATSWAAWWVGDTLGVLIVLPLLLVFTGEPRALWRARLRPMALPMLLFFGLFVVIFIRVSAWENDQQMLEFRLVSQQVRDKIRTGLEEQALLLEQLNRSFSRQATITRSDFRDLAGDALRHFPALQAVEWAPRVADGERANFEAEQSRAFAGFQIGEVAPSGAPRRAGTRAEYYPVSYIEPMAGNERALGLDLISDPERETAVARALASGAVGAMRPIRVGPEPRRQTGLLLLLPVRTGGDGAGLLVLVLRVDAFIAALSGDSQATLHLRFTDGTSGGTFYDGFAGPPSSAGYRREIDFGLRHFLVETEPTASYLAHKRGWQSWALLAAGVFGTGLLGALLLLGTGYAHRIRIQVEERTRELAVANRRLRGEIEERRNAEAALRQAQRMEAIGRLTGGIAHDFNNLLTVVAANAELLHSEPLGQRGQRSAAAILRAADRGGRLTRQLLAFSRQQTLRPEIVDFRQRTAEIAEMLARILRDDIEISIDLPEGLWPVAIDPGEFDLAILNIAVNARDAMPAGGQFHLVARNRSVTTADSIDDGLVGDFVALTLADTGVGMSAEVMAHAFDPYFTTKEVGAGSGLGLSQVYGFAKQSGGGAVLVSVPGGGTGLSLYLPRAPVDAAAPLREAGDEGGAAA